MAETENVKMLLAEKAERRHNLSVEIMLMSFATP